MDENTNKWIIRILILSLFMNLFMFYRISNIKSSLENLNNQLVAINQNINSSNNNISYSISQALKKEASIINDFQFEFGEFKDGMVDLNLKVKPKKVSSENEYYFSYIHGDDGPKLTPAIEGEGYIYYASIKVPIKDNIEIDFVIKNNSTNTVESLDYIYNYEQRLLESYDIDIASNNTSYSGESIVLDNNVYRLTQNQYEYKNGEEREKKPIKSANIKVVINGKIIDSFPMKKEINSFPHELNIYEFKFQNYSIPIEGDYVFELYILAEHEDGYKIRFNLDKFGLDKEGNPMHYMHDIHGRFIVEE